MYPSEFKHLQELSDIFAKYDLRIGRMISGSKSGYRERFPNNLVVFNANIITKYEKVWHGDIDITLDAEALKKVAEELDTTLYVLREMDFRFGAENQPIEDAIKKAVWDTNK